MINFKPKIPAMLGALAVLTAGAAHAELLEYTFKAPDGTQRSLTPNANYANPTGNISFALSAGIDRKVKISVLRSDGTVVSTATSHLLGATDRITVGGKSYYGAELQLYVSNGMSAGNTRNEARVQGLSEVFERYVKNRIIAESISLPEIPADVLARYPAVVEAIETLEAEGFPIFAYDGSLGGQYPVICVVLFNPANGTCFASFGAHPDFGVALERTVTELLQGRGLKDLDVFTPPTFDDEEVAEHTNLETHFIDSSGLISWDLFKQDADYPFVDWSFSGTTEEEFATLMAIFKKEDKEVYIADYEHLGVYACRIIVPGMSDIYPAEDLWLANNSMGSHLRETILSLPGSEWEKEDYLNLIEQLDEEGFDDFTRVRELLGLATGSDNGWYTLRIGELKAMLALAGGDLEQALVWTEWTMEFNSSVFSPERANYYRCLQTLLLLAQEEDRQPLQYLNAFVRMYGADAVEAASAAMSGEAAFYGLQPVDSDLHAFAAHQSLLKAYEKLQRAKAAFWAK